MTGTGSGDAEHELLALDEVGDAAPPDRRNGAQDRLGASAGVNYETTAREREGTPPHVARRNLGFAWTRGRELIMLNPASDDVICGLTRDGCCDGDRERDRTTDGVGVVSLPCWTQRQSL